MTYGHSEWVHLLKIGRDHEPRSANLIGTRGKHTFREAMMPARSSPAAVKPIELPYVAWSTKQWVSSGLVAITHVCRLTGVENKSLNPRCDIHGWPMDFDLILKPLQESMNVFYHRRLILCDVVGCKLRMSDFQFELGSQSHYSSRN